MKKLRLLGITLFSVFILTGCGGGKTLTCTNTESANGIEMGQEAVMKFKNDQVHYIKMTIDAKATSDLIKKNWNMFASTLEKQYTDKKANGIKLSNKNDAKNYSYQISIEVDLDKATESDLKKYNLDGIAGKSDSYKDVKKSAEDSGFKCE